MWVGRWVRQSARNDVHLPQHGRVVLAVVLEGELGRLMGVGVVEPQCPVAGASGDGRRSLRGEQKQRSATDDGAQAPFQPFAPEFPQLTPNDPNALREGKS